MTSLSWLLFVGLFISGYSVLLFELNYLYIVLPALGLILVYLILLKVFDRSYVTVSQKSHIVIDDALTAQFITSFGGEANMVSVTFQHSRLKVEVVNTKLVNLEDIKALGATGVFVAGNRIQAFVGNDAEKLEKSIKHYLTR